MGFSTLLQPAIIPADVALLCHPQKTKKSGRAILSVIVNAGGRHSWKDRLLAGRAVQFRRLGQWTDQQMKIHEWQMEKALLPLFITIRPPPVWQLWPQCLAVGESSTDCNKNSHVLPGRRVSELASCYPLPRSYGADGRFTLNFVLRLIATSVWEQQNCV